MNIDTFRQIYGSEMQELYSVETQLTEALPKMLDKARRVELKQVLRNHLQETRSLNWRTARAST
jgi:ferritin-like metal-binding protein YciE